jgi:lysophospholipase L1-like esterase
MIRAFILLSVFACCAFAQILTPPVRPEVRQSISRRPTYREVSSPPGTVQLSGSIGGLITGWGTPVGVVQNFNRIEFPLTCSVSGFVATRVRARVREGAYNGTLLADETVNVSLDLGDTRRITVTFGESVANTSGTNLWVEIITDGRIDEWRISTTPYTTPTARFWTDANVTSPASVPTEASSLRNYPFTFFAEDSTTTESFLSATMTELVERDTIFNRIVVPTYAVNASTIVGTATATQLATSSTFSGWGMAMPATYSTNAFDAVAFYIYPFDSSAIPTQVRVRIKQLPASVSDWDENPSTFTILADTTVDVAPASGVFNKVSAKFSAPIYGTNLWIEYVCDGRDGARAASATATNLVAAPPGRWYMTGSSLSSGTWVKASSDLAFYLEAGLHSSDVSSFTVTEEFKSKLGNVASTETVTIQLPATTWALEGRERNIYFDNIIRSTAPLDNLWIDVTATKGAQFGSFGGYWRYTPTSGDAGTSTLTIAVRDVDTGQTYATASSSLVTRALSYPASPVSRKLHCIGDSTLGSSGAAVLAELVRLFNGDTQYTLSLVGSNDGNFNDSTATSRAVRCDAISGWRVDMLHTNSATAWTEIGGTARTGSPFVWSGAFNYGAFLSSNSITMGSGDWVLFHLGINDVFSFTSDSNVSAQMDDMVTRLEAMITNIQAAASGVKIVVCTVIPPNASQDAFGVDYTINQTRKRYRRNRDLWAERILSQFGGRTASNVWVLGYGDALDTVNNFTKTSTAFNARNAGTYSGASSGSGVHPDPMGYYQLADTIRAFLKGVE